MKKYSFTCTCGQEIAVDAESLEEAQTKFKSTMTLNAVTAHFEEYHPRNELPPYEAFMENALANLGEVPKEADDIVVN